MRCDVFLSENGYAKSRTQAREMIEAGHVKINGVHVKKPAESVDDSVDVMVEILQSQPFVGRGGIKLEHALNCFGISVAGLSAIDVGASTGGFTDCLLKRGASRVIAVDSGENQLDPTLRRDSRVICMEKYNARYIKPEDFLFIPDIAVMDVSFISQTLILPALANLLPQEAYVVSLIKPQFEVGRRGVGKKGIVKKVEERINAVRSVLLCGEESGLGCVALTVSPITGGDGNIEFLAAFRKGVHSSVGMPEIKMVAEGRA